MASALRAHALPFYKKGNFMSRKFEPDEHQRFKVAVMMKCGFTLEETAREIGVDIKTLKKTCKREIKEGKRIFLARLEMKLSQKALAGDTVAMLFVMKCQKGWRETARLEMTGADGKPIEPPRLGISFEMGGPGIVRKTPYNMDADPNLHLPLAQIDSRARVMNLSKFRRRRHSRRLNPSL